MLALLITIRALLTPVHTTTMAPDEDGLAWVCITDGEGNIEHCEQKYIELDY